MKKIIIIGAGGNSKVILDTILNRVQIGEQIKINGVLDDDDRIVSLKNHPVLGPIEDIEKYSGDRDVYFVNGIGNNQIRREIYHRYASLRYYTVIHPGVLLGSGVEIGEGSVIMPGAIINTDTFIGRHVLINTGAIIEHDNYIEDFVHVASGAATAGNVTIREASMLGTGSKVIQGLNIGKDSVIGAGAVVISNIPDHCTAVGVPAKVR